MKSRMRGRNNNNGSNNYRRFGQNLPNRNSILDSVGPCGRIRGSAHQLVEKYLSAAKDALAQDDRVAAETCYQYADHYNRILLTIAESEAKRAEQSQPSSDRQPEDGMQEDPSFSQQPEEENLPRSFRQSRPQQPQPVVQVPAPLDEPALAVVASQAEPAPSVPPAAVDAWASMDLSVPDLSFAARPATEAVGGAPAPRPRPRPKQTITLVKN